MYALLAMVTQIGNTPPPQKKKKKKTCVNFEKIQYCPRRSSPLCLCRLLPFYRYHHCPPTVTVLQLPDLLQEVCVRPPHQLALVPLASPLVGRAEGRGIDLSCFQALTKKKEEEEAEGDAYVF